MAAQTGSVLLTVSGLIGDPAGRSGPIDFDLARLQALPPHSITTSTPWDARPVTFSGPLLRTLLASVRARGQRLLASALNAYKVEIPAGDAQRHEVIVALLADGQPMRVRDRGPLCIVYPFDGEPSLRSEPYYARSIWQLRSIEVR